MAADCVISALKKKERAKKGNLINMRKYLKAGCKQNGARLCTVVPSGRAKGNGHKQTHGRCPLNIRKHLFILGVAEHWYRLPREKIMESPSSEIFKALWTRSWTTELLLQHQDRADGIQRSLTASALLSLCASSQAVQPRQELRAEEHTRCY